MSLVEEWVEVTQVNFSEDVIAGHSPGMLVLNRYVLLLLFNLVKTRQSGKSTVGSNDGVRRSSGMFPSEEILYIHIFVGIQFSQDQTIRKVRSRISSGGLSKRWCETFKWYVSFRGNTIYITHFCWYSI